MTIRLTSPEAFDKVLEKLKQDPMYSDEVNGMFMKYAIPSIRDELAKGGDEWYLDIDWLHDSRVGKVAMVIRYHKRSDIQTDEEYLTEKENEECGND